MLTLASADVSKVSILGQDDVPPLGQSVLSVGLTPTMIRFLGHLPYFKVASAAMLPQALGLGGSLVTAFIYATLCLAVTRWSAARHSPVTATLALLAAMMVVGPAVALALPAAPIETTIHGLSGMMLPYLGLLLPIAGGFLAIQFLVGQHCQGQVTSMRLKAQANRK